MITILSDLPPNVLGAEASGTVIGADYRDILVPAVEAHLERNETLRVLFVLGPAFDGFESSAMWQDAQLGLGKVKAWERVAVVTDHEHIRGLIKTFGFAIPGEVKTFEMDDLADAKTWVAQ